MDLKQFSEAVQIATGVATIAVGIFALITFRRNARLNRAQWLEKLHTKFFESPIYKRLRLILDYEPAPEFDHLRRAIRGEHADDDLCESLSEYLNFFEYIACLWALGQLSEAEILMLFQYYIRLLHRHDFVWDFVRKHDFENLESLFDRLPGINHPEALK